ncbi:hypothetical protein MHYP_G00273900 [Metynnis hypsauchen]
MWAQANRPGRITAPTKHRDVRFVDQSGPTCLPVTVSSHKAALLPTAAVSTASSVSPHAWNCGITQHVVADFTRPATRCCFYMFIPAGPPVRVSSLRETLPTQPCQASRHTCSRNNKLRAGASAQPNLRQLHSLWFSPGDAPNSPPY